MTSVLPSSTIKTPQNALWWSFSTIATVGYGDKYPATTPGRILGAILMIAGVGVFGTITAAVGSWILKAPAKSTDHEAPDSP